MAASPLSISNRAILKIVEGLKCLDGVSNDTAKIERYDFDENLGWDISKDRDIFERAEVVYNKAKSAAAARLGVVDKMKLTEANAPAVAQFVEQNEGLLDKTQDLTGVLKLNRKALWKAGVKIPGIYSSLMPILVE